MNKHLLAVASTALALSATAPASAAVTIDGVLDAAYGAPTATVSYDPAAPTSNFNAPTAASNTIGYSIYLTSDANYVYGYLQTTSPTTANNFANLYFDVDAGNGATSDVVYEITNQTGSVGGVPFPAPITFFAGNGVIEFALPNFYLGAHAPGDVVYLRMSQSFGYSVAGGPSYGTDSLGAITIGGAAAAVPETATWAMMLAGFAMVGGALRRRSTRIVFA